MARIAPWFVRAPAAALSAAGSVANINSNTLQSLDPEDDATQNSLYPGTAPWVGGINPSGWVHVTDFSGSVLVPTVGTKGSVWVFGDAGHSAGGPSIWAKCDIATGAWSLVGIALQASGLISFTAGSDPPTTQFDHTWGNWLGASTDWAAPWRQTGFNPPAGSHTRAGFFFRPPAKAGNTDGEIWTTWQPTGMASGTGLRGSFVYDIDTGLWAHTTTLRPTVSSLEASYDETNDIGLCAVRESSFFYDNVYYIDCATATWITVPITISEPSRPYLLVDSTQFILGDLFVVAINSGLDGPAVPTEFWACKISEIVAAGTLGSGGVTPTLLTVTASSWPVAPYSDGKINAMTCRWVNFSDGNLYATNRGDDAHGLWKLTPPAGDTAAKLAGTWVVTEQTALTGADIATGNTDYSRLQYVPVENAFSWFGDGVTGPLQLIRP